MMQDYKTDHFLHHCPGPIAVRMNASDECSICSLALFSGRFAVHILAPRRSQGVSLLVGPAEPCSRKHFKFETPKILECRFGDFLEV